MAFVKIFNLPETSNQLDKKQIKTSILETIVSIGELGLTLEDEMGSEVFDKGPYASRDAIVLVVEGFNKPHHTPELRQKLAQVLCEFMYVRYDRMHVECIIQEGGYWSSVLTLNGAQEILDDKEQALRLAAAMLSGNPWKSLPIPAARRLVYRLEHLGYLDRDPNPTDGTVGKAVYPVQ
jgi:septum formation topological specificity factor MinE